MTHRPNILFILSDQHNAGIMGCAGDPTIRTPAIDRLAGDGVLFEQAYCQNPLCVPSRMSLLSGRYCKSIGIYDNTSIMEPNSCTLPRALSGAGYRSCLIGKAHFNGEQFHGYGERPYGDIYGQAHQPDPRRTPESGESGLGNLVGNAGPTDIPLPLTQTEICVSESAKWLQTHVDMHPDQPFMLSVNFDKPHFPVRCPARFFKNYEGRIPAPTVPEGFRENAVPFVRMAMDRFGFNDQDAERYLAAYRGCIEWVDDAVGRVLETLDYLGLSENTIVIYGSDHGDMCGEKGTWNKTLFFDQSARTPLVFRWPGRFPQNTHIPQPVGLIDIFPTLCELTGVAVPESCEGTSLADTLTTGAPPPRDHVFCESAFLGAPDKSGCMIRTDRWKYNRYLDGTEELYDMHEDPHELKNLAKAPGTAETAGSLRKQVVDFWKPEEQPERLASCPRVAGEKHFYEFSNQFMLGNGIITNARP